MRTLYLPAYTGSLHVNVTLPVGAGNVSTAAAFADAHRLAAMALQWLEPLLVTVLGAPHPFRPLRPAVFAAISFRHANEGLAGLASNDLTQGVSAKRWIVDGLQSDAAVDPEASAVVGDAERRVRYVVGRAKDAARGLVQTEGVPSWIRNMMTRGDTTAAAFVAEKYAECPCKPFVGSDFRNETRQRTGRFGFEFRTLDRVPLDALPDVLRFLFYAFDASATPAAAAFLATPAGNAARSSAFDGFMLGAAKAGGSAPVTKAYAAGLSRLFGATLKPETPATDALASISARLFAAHGGGRGRYSACFDIDAKGGRYGAAPVLPDLNAAAAAYHRSELGGADGAKGKARKGAKRGKKA
jgi:hypothetical protein